MQHGSLGAPSPRRVASRGPRGGARRRRKAPSPPKRSARPHPLRSDPLTPVPSEHVIFKSFFLLDSAPGRLLRKPQLESCNLGKRGAIIYSQNDLAGAWSRDESGDYELEVTPGGESQRELAIRLGINLCMYALCLDYKDDAVHLPLIMNKRR